MKPDTIVAAVSAAATWTAVAIAIWGEKLRSWLFKPSLHLALLSPIGEAVRVDYNAVVNGQQVKTSVNGRYYHIHIRNLRTFPAANDVQVLITRVETPSPSGNPQLIYTGELPLRWRHQEIYPLTRRIGRETDADLLYVTEEPTLRLTPLIVPNNFPAEHRGATKFWVTLMAHSVEGRSNVLRIEVAWDGRWEPGESEMQRHLEITSPEVT